MTGINDPFFQGTKVDVLTIDMIDRRGALVNPIAEKTIVMFYASWCGGCKQAKPYFAKFAKMVQNKKNIKVYAIDWSEASRANAHLIPNMKYTITSFPTFIGFSNGEPYSIFQEDGKIWSSENMKNYTEKIGSKWGK